MPVVIEFTLHPIPGHFDEVLSTYLAFAEQAEAQFEALQLLLACAEPGASIVRGVAVYESAQVAEGLTSMPFFANLSDALAPHLASPPERVELSLLGIFLTGTPLAEGTLESAALVELEWHAKLGHLQEMLEVYEPMIEKYEREVPDCHLVLETVNEAAAMVRVFLLYDHHDAAVAAESSPLVARNIDALMPLLSAPPTRSELRVVHVFVRA